MIIPDVNLLLYAYNEQSRAHESAKQWWENLLSDTATVGLAWVVILGFIRISTNPKLAQSPLKVSDATDIVQSWMARHQTITIDPGHRHSEILFYLLDAIGSAGNLTTDAHLAALAIEHQAELHSCDPDRGRFPGLKWINPIAGATTVHKRPPW